MLRTFLLLLALAASAVAELKWENPWQEFHRRPADGRVNVSFAFENTGATPVKVVSVKTSCGCTTAKLEKKVYAPGERGLLAAQFSFGGRKGVHRKQLTVTTDDGARHQLDFVTTIEEAMTVTPELVYWRVGAAPEPKPVLLSVAAKTPVKVKGVTSSNPAIAARLSSGSGDGQYVVTVTPANTSAKQTAEITVATDYPADAPRSYTIYARVK